MRSRSTHDHPLLQLALINEIAHLGATTDPWIVVYRDERKQDDSRRVDYCALITPDSVPGALRHPDWRHDLHNHPQLLGDTDDIDGLIYSRSGHYPDGEHRSEQLVILQDHYPIRPTMLPQLSEEFRIYHDLWLDPTGTKAYKIYNSGDDELAAELSAEQVRVRTPLVRQYLAGRRLALLVLTDSLQVSPPPPPDILVPISEDFPPQEEEASMFRLVRMYGDHGPNTMKSTRVIGKTVLYPGPVEQSGIYPYDNVDNIFPEFVIGIDHLGKEERFPCDPRMLKPVLGGANADAPSYLTPVFFNRTVLRRYFDNPKYLVEDGMIRCGNLWAMRVDLDRDDYVVAYLGDLGEYLPSRERQHWVPYSVVPQGGISTTTYRRHFLNEAAPARTADRRFLYLYRELNTRWMSIHGWPLFRRVHEQDRHILNVHIPLDEDSSAEFDELVLALTKLLIDYLNKRELENSLDQSVEDEGSIATLHRWLQKKHYPSTERDINYLKTLQNWRSRGVAHGKGSGFDKLQASTSGSRKDTFKDLLEQANVMLEDLRTFLLSVESF